MAVALDLQALRASVASDEPATHAGLGHIGREIGAVFEDVREISRGLHPGLLSKRGLGPSLRALARSSPIPVRLELSLERRPPESIEIAVYYAVLEALTNAAKHAQASEVTVVVASSGTLLHASVADDGVGGARATAGSGLGGLIDRVEALGGRFALHSQPGEGTRISIELPLSVRGASDGAYEAGLEPSTGNDDFLPQTDLLRVADAATLLAAVAAVADALCVIDAQGRIRYLLPSAARILGYDDERQLVGRPWHDTIHYRRPDGTPFPATECPTLRARVAGETVHVDEDWFVRQDGSMVPVAYSSAPLPLPDGRGAVMAFRETDAAVAAG